MQINDLLFRGGLTLALGLIIGFQRERKESTLAGIRTFPIFALCGFFTAALESSGVSWAVGFGLVGMSALLVAGIMKHHEQTEGLTTEAAAVFTYLLGVAFIYFDHVELVVVAGGVCALLLHMKDRMRSAVETMNLGEVKALMQFVLIACVILPILPNRTIDDLGVINPRNIWYMVVLITGISLVSYAIQKIKRGESGTIWTGVLGGMVSSTAATVTLSRISVKHPTQFALIPALILASAVSNVRVIVEVFLISPQTFKEIIVPISILFLVMVVLSVLFLIRGRKEKPSEKMIEERGPSELTAALVFGFMFSVILYFSSWARQHYGQDGLYIVSIISGLIDVDAITLSTSQLVEHGTVAADLGWRLIMSAILSNLCFKTAMVLAISKGMVRKYAGISFGITIIAGALIIIIG